MSLVPRTYRITQHTDGSKKIEVYLGEEKINEMQGSSVAALIAIDAVKGNSEDARGQVKRIESKLQQREMKNEAKKIKSYSLTEYEVLEFEPQKNDVSEANQSRQSESKESPAQVAQREKNQGMGSGKGKAKK